MLQAHDSKSFLMNIHAKYKNKNCNNQKRLRKKWKSIPSRWHSNKNVWIISLINYSFEINYITNGTMMSSRGRWLSQRPTWIVQSIILRQIMIEFQPREHTCSNSHHHPRSTLHHVIHYPSLPSSYSLYTFHSFFAGLYISLSMWKCSHIILINI